MLPRFMRSASATGKRFRVFHAKIVVEEVLIFTLMESMKTS